MEFRYDDMLAFMERYFRDYSAYGQDPKTQHRMSEYFAPELEFIPYDGNPPFHGREEFLKVNTHPPIQETLTQGELAIDERKGIVAAMVKTELKHKASGEIRLSAWFNAFYYLKPDEDGSFRIKKIVFFFERTPETERALEIMRSQ
jgi:hypothetical protein